MKQALTLFAVVVCLVFARAADPTVSRFKLLTAPGPIGTLTVTESGNSIDTDFRIDDNGRDAKLKEHIVLGQDEFPQRWEIDGHGDGGAPVKERFVIEAG